MFAIARLGPDQIGVPRSRGVRVVGGASPVTG